MYGFGSQTFVSVKLFKKLCVNVVMQYLLYDRNLSAVVMRSLEVANIVDSVSYYQLHEFHFFQLC